MRLTTAALVLASLMAGGGAVAQTTQPLTVSFSNYAFAPATLTLKAGQTYRIHFGNDASKSHDFSAPEFFAAATIAPDDRAKIENGEKVDLEGGQSVDITLTPDRAGTYIVTCTHFMHAMMGMKGTIIVQ